MWRYKIHDNMSMWRETVVFCLFVSAFVIIVLRLFYWQVVNGENLRKEASLQYSLKFAIPANRGEIITSDRSPLVMNVPSYLVYAQPKGIERKDDFARQIAPILSQEEQTILELI